MRFFHRVFRDGCRWGTERITDFMLFPWRMKNSSDLRNSVHHVCSSGYCCPQLHHSPLVSVNPASLKQSHLGTGFCGWLLDSGRTQSRSPLFYFETICYWKRVQEHPSEKGFNELQAGNLKFGCTVGWISSPPSFWPCSPFSCASSGFSSSGLPWFWHAVSPLLRDSRGGKGLLSHITSDENIYIVIL